MSPWILVAASVFTVLLVALLVRWLGFDGHSDGTPQLPDDPRGLADQLLYGFEAEHWFNSRDRRQALLLGPDGTAACLWMQGAHPAARRLPTPLSWRRRDNRIDLLDASLPGGETLLDLADSDRDKLLTLL